MGADGGIVYIPLLDGNADSYIKLEKLLSPFWQFLSTNVSDIAENAYHEWRLNNPEIKPPKYIIGLYGTDRGNNLDISELSYFMSASGEEECDYLFDWTFEELDLEFRTGQNWEYSNHILYRLWYEHFKYFSEKETNDLLGELSSMTIINWCNSLNELLDLSKIYKIETWT